VSACDGYGFMLSALSPVAKGVYVRFGDFALSAVASIGADVVSGPWDSIVHCCALVSAEF